MTDKEAVDFLRKANIVLSVPRRGGKTITQILYAEALSRAISALEEKTKALPIGEKLTCLECDGCEFSDICEHKKTSDTE